MKIKDCKVTTEYKSPFPNPLKLQKNDRVQFVEKESEWSGWIWCINKNGNEGWVPKSYLEIRGKSAKLLQDYDATELTANVGEILTIKKEESGWFWVTDKEGRNGWIPIKNVKLMG